MFVSRKALLVVLALATASNAFTVSSPAYAKRPTSLLLSSSSSSSDDTTTAVSQNDNTDDPLGLTPELRRLTDAFEAIGDDKLRYKQLLYMASNGLEAMPETLKTDENKVLGCLSTVHVYATPRRQDNDDIVIDFQGDSDGLLTKGLVALLVRGLSGNTAAAIQKVDPQFIQTAGISQSLTPGRNNGFLNMLALMKQKALEVANSSNEGTSSDEASAEEEATTASSSASSNNDRPMYNGILEALQKLQPTHLELIDNSHEHAGHAGNTGNGTESHFQLTIVADAFEGLNLVKRHQLIYMMLGDIMPQIHALQIQAQTPEEAGK